MCLPGAFDERKGWQIMTGYRRIGKKDIGVLMLALLIAFAFLFLIFGVPYLVQRNLPWRSNAKMIGLAEAAASGENTEKMDEDTVIGQPYVVVFFQGFSEHSADLQRAEIWEKPAWSLNDRNIGKIATFVLVLNRSEDWGQYSDGEGITTFSAILQYYDQSGKFLGCEFIEADPLPEEKQSGSEADIFVSKSKVLQAVEKHLGEPETE